MKKLALILTMAALLPSGAAQAEDPLILPIQRLAMSMAVKAAQATIDAQAAADEQATADAEWRTIKPAVLRGEA